MSRQRSRTPSIDSRHYAISEEGYTSHLSESEGEESSGLEQASQSDSHESLFITENSGSLWMNQTQDTPMFDVSNYLFESINKSLNSIDFSEAIALQTKTSAVVNSKSRELKALIKELQERLKYFANKYEEGALISHELKQNFREISRRISDINDSMLRRFPIEYNQAREKVLERTLNDS